MSASWSGAVKSSRARRQPRLCRGAETRMRTGILARRPFPARSHMLWRFVAESTASWSR
jgi:hypothetical protein